MSAPINEPEQKIDINRFESPNMIKFDKSEGKILSIDKDSDDINRQVLEIFQLVDEAKKNKYNGIHYTIRNVYSGHGNKLYQVLQNRCKSEGIQIKAKRMNIDGSSDDGCCVMTYIAFCCCWNPCFGCKEDCFPIYEFLLKWKI